MKKNGKFLTFSMALFLAFSLVGCGGNRGETPDPTGTTPGITSGEAGTESGVTQDEMGVQMGMGEENLEAGQKDLAGEDGIVGSHDPSTTLNPASTAYDSNQGQPIGDTMKRMGDGIKNTIDEMGHAASDMARDVKKTLE